MPNPETEPILPRVTNDTLNGIAGSIIEKRSFFPETDDTFRAQQPELFDVVVAWAQTQGPEAVTIARAAAALTYHALSQQTASDQMNGQHPEL